LASFAAERDTERQQRSIAEARERELRQELTLVEMSLAAQLPLHDVEDEPAIDLGGVVVLYVGGRAHQMAQLRTLTEQTGASFLHHDGGIKLSNRIYLIGLTSVAPSRVWPKFSYDTSLTIRC
jgi:hypothetical protein